jgi:hypothetical protein
MAVGVIKDQIKMRGFIYIVEEREGRGKNKDVNSGQDAEQPNNAFLVRL